MDTPEDVAAAEIARRLEGEARGKPLDYARCGLLIGAVVLLCWANVPGRGAAPHDGVGVFPVFAWSSGRGLQVHWLNLGLVGVPALAGLLRGRAKAKLLRGAARRLRTRGGAPLTTGRP